MGEMELQKQITDNTEDIGRHDERIKNLEKAMDAAHDALRGITKEVNTLTARVALIVGTIMTLATLIQIFVK